MDDGFIRQRQNADITSSESILFNAGDSRTGHLLRGAEYLCPRPTSQPGANAQAGMMFGGKGAIVKVMRSR